MKLVTKASGIFDGTIGRLAWLAGGLIFLATLLVSFEVITRYILGHTVITWVVEVTEYMLLYFTFLGTAWVLKREGHVRMDFVLNRLNPRSQAMLNTITSILGAVLCLILTWLATQTTWDNFVTGYYVDTTLDPPIFYFHGIVALGSFLLIIQFLRMAWGYGQRWKALSNK